MRIRAPSSLRVHSGRMRVAPGGSGHREVLRLTLTVVAVEGVVAVSCLIKVASSGCGLFPLVGEGQRVDDGRLSWGLRYSVTGGPIGRVSGLVFAPARSLMVKFCWIPPPPTLSLQQFGSHRVWLE